MYFHGGGYLVGSARTGAHLAIDLARRIGGRALSVEYRLGPEDPYPGPAEGGLAAYTGLLDSGVDPASGAGRRLVRRRTGRKHPARRARARAAAAGFSPWADITRSGMSMHAKEAADPLFSYDAAGWHADRYMPSGDRSMPLASFVFASLAGLPPLLIQAGSHEVLLDDACRLAANAARDDVEVVLQVTPQVPHVFQRFSELGEASEALDEAARFLRRHLQ